MICLWDDRLAEVWAPPGLAGAGVVGGASSVLTARHVIENALTERPAGHLQARVVRPNGPVGPWARMVVSWSDLHWDLALLSVDATDATSEQWLAPQSSDPVVVTLTTQ